MSGFLDQIRNRVLLFDGGLGTELFRRGFPQGACPESWNLERPDVVQSIHRDYFEAGSDAVLTNSLGASSIKLGVYGLSSRAYEINRKAAELAVAVKPAGRFVGGSLGPVGKFLKPQGGLVETDLEEAYAEQARSLRDGGADFLLLETQYDLREARAGLMAARRAVSLPVFVTMTFDRKPRGFFTLMGDTPAACFAALEADGAAGLGANCSLDSKDMADLTGLLRPLTTLPMIIQANAGRPCLSLEGTVSYSQGVADYVRYVPEMIRQGANAVGGCCGTTPDYIRAMARLLRG